MAALMASGLQLSSRTLKLKTKRFTRNPRIRFDFEKLNDPKIGQVFQAKVGEKFGAFRVLDSNVDTLANNLEKGLLSTAEEALGRQRKKIQPWVTTRF